MLQQSSKSIFANAVTKKTEKQHIMIEVQAVKHNSTRLIDKPNMIHIISVYASY